jgi:hypothetical protein
MTNTTVGPSERPQERRPLVDFTKMSPAQSAIWVYLLGLELEGGRSSLKAADIARATGYSESTVRKNIDADRAGDFFSSGNAMRGYVYFVSRRSLVQRIRDLLEGHQRRVADMSRMQDQARVVPS